MAGHLWCRLYTASTCISIKQIGYRHGVEYQGLLALHGSRSQMTERQQRRGAGGMALSPIFLAASRLLPRCCARQARFKQSIYRRHIAPHKRGIKQGRREDNNETMKAQWRGHS